MLIPLLLSAFAVQSAPAAGRPLEGLGARIDTLEGQGGSGFVRVTRGDEVLFERGFGFADREQKHLWNARTLTTLGSITKPLTATLILELVEEGKLAVDDPLAEHLEGLPEDKRGITLSHLLTHSSGLFELSREVPDHEWISREDFLGTVLEAPLRFAPGERYEYSNSGYSVLAAVIEKVTGESFDHALRARVLAPGGARESGYLRAGFERERLAIGYRGDTRWGTLPDDVYTPDGVSWVLYGNGGVLSSAEQMQALGLALLDGKVLSQRSLETMWTPRIDESNGSKASFYGYGWVVGELGGKRYAMHNGGNRVFFCDFAIVPQERLVIYTATNALPQTGGLDGLLGDVLAHLLAGRPL
jgi:CubicO group peptidase (beta-lactamase class C family)